MKIIKAIVNKVRTENKGTTFSYPDGWDEYKINVLAYEDSDDLGEVTEFCVALVHDDTYAGILLQNADIEEIDDTTANILGDKCKPQRLVVDDLKLQEILVAIDKPKEARTSEEQDMLDPDKDTNGIRRTQKFDVRRWYPK